MNNTTTYGYGILASAFNELNVSAALESENESSHYSFETTTEFDNSYTATGGGMNFLNATDVSTPLNNGDIYGNETTASMFNTTESDYSPYSPFEYRVVLGNFNLFLLIVGCIGNVLCITVLTREKLRKSSTAIYLTGLAVSDIVILINASGSAYVMQFWNIHVRNQGAFACKISIFLTYSSVATSSWILIAVTMERVISVTFPYQIKTSCTPKLAKIVVVVIWLVIYGLNCHFLFGMDYVYYPADDVFCYPQNDEYLSFVETVVPWIDFTLVFAVPYAFIFCGNIIIIVQLTRNLLKRNQMTSTKKTADHSLTVTLVFINIMFMVTISPLPLFYAAFPYHDLDDPVKYFYLMFLNETLNLLSNVNAAANFFLYFLSGKKFRSEVKALICRCSCAKRDRSMTVSQGSTTVTTRT